MKSVLIGLFLILMTACTTTEYVTRYKERKVIPPADLLVTHDRPFNQKPGTYGEAVKRDPVWLDAWLTYDEQVKELRKFFGFDIEAGNQSDNNSE